MWRSSKLGPASAKPLNLKPRLGLWLASRIAAGELDSERVVAALLKPASAGKSGPAQQQCSRRPGDCGRAASDTRQQQGEPDGVVILRSDCGQGAQDRLQSSRSPQLLHLQPQRGSFKIPEAVTPNWCCKSLLRDPCLLGDLKVRV